MRFQYFSLRWLAAGLFSSLATILSPVVCAQDTTASQAAIDFARQVQPILAKHCYACHGPGEAEGGLQFTSKEAAFSELDSGFHAIVAGKPSESEVFKRLIAEDEDERMPPRQIGFFRKRSRSFANGSSRVFQWYEHWGFSEPRTVDVPKVGNAQWNQASD